jgi:phage replication-related protein YjqB (UPF0714/DUF867 family)
MEIADRVAGEEHAFYCFEGIKPKGNAMLHITSEHFDEPRGLDVLRAVDVVLAIHGCKGEDNTVLVGGLNVYLRQAVYKALVRAGFRGAESVSPMLRGESPRNMCNRGRACAGVQLEISLGLRKRMLGDTIAHKDGNPGNESFYLFVSALRKVLSCYEANIVIPCR